MQYHKADSNKKMPKYPRTKKNQNFIILYNLEKMCIVETWQKSCIYKC